MAKKEEKQENITSSKKQVLTKETLGMILIVFSVLVLLIACTGELIFGSIGLTIQNFLLGTLGFSSYLILIAVLYSGIVMLRGKGLVCSKKIGILSFLAVIFFVCAVHCITLSSYALSNGYIKCIVYCYESVFINGFSAVTGGGVIFSIITYPVLAFAKVIGGCAIFLGLMAICLFLIFNSKEFKKYMSNKKVVQQPKKPTTEEILNEYKGEYSTKEYPVDIAFTDVDVEESIATSKRLHCVNDVFTMKDSRTQEPPTDYSKLDSRKIIFESEAEKQEHFKKNLIFDKNSHINKRLSESKDELSVEEKNQTEQLYSKIYEKEIDCGVVMPSTPIKFVGNSEPKGSEEYTTIEVDKYTKSERQQYKDNDFANRLIENAKEYMSYDDGRYRSYIEVYDEPIREVDDYQPLKNLISSEKIQSSIFNSSSSQRENTYACPNFDLFDHYEETPSMSESELKEMKRVIVNTLGNFRISSEIAKVTQGASVTRYDIRVPANVNTNKVLSLDKELALALHAKGGVNITYNFEQGTISLDIPNAKRAMVSLKHALTCDEYIEADEHKTLCFPIGRNIENEVLCGDLVKMKHILVAGATGSGKSIFLNSLILSLITKYSPEDLRLILIDPKQVEFNIYNNLPHLMINEIIDGDVPRVINVLNWAINEMERRYTLFKEKSQNDDAYIKDLESFNDFVTKEEKLPKIVIVIDELCDLMSMAQKEIESRIQRLAQKSRAAGLHLVVATQHPSAEVVTGILKANLPTRFCFKVVEDTYSRIILNCGGGEKLLGNGDLLYKTDNMSMPCRLQSCFVSAHEVKNIVRFVKDNNAKTYDNSVLDYINKKTEDIQIKNVHFKDSNVNEMYLEVLRYVIKRDEVSIPEIQKRYNVNFTEIGEIISWMEENNYISKPKDGQSRRVLICKEEFEDLYGKFD